MIVKYLPQYLYILGSVCFIIGTLIQMHRAP